MSDSATDSDLHELKLQVQWLLDKEAIRNTKLLYCRFADNGRYDDFEALFTEDLRVEINGPPTADGTPPNKLTFATKADWITFQRRQGAIRHRLDLSGGRDAPTISGDGKQLAGTAAWSVGAAHHMHGGEIEFTGPNSARAIWPSQFDGINGYYDEEYRREGGVWKIARERFFAQASRAYRDGDYPYELEVGTRPTRESRHDAVSVVAD